MSTRLCNVELADVPSEPLPPQDPAQGGPKSDFPLEGVGQPGHRVGELDRKELLLECAASVELSTNF